MLSVELVSKIILAVCNGILTSLVLGNIAILILNINKPSKDDAISDSAWDGAMGAGILTSVLFVVIVIGWVAIFRKGRTWLLIYAILAIIFSVVLLSGGIVVLVKDIEGDRDVTIDKLNKRYKDYSTSEVTKTMIDDMHVYYKCCGADKPILINNEYPKSCCETLDGDKCLRPYQKSCADALRAEHSAELTGSITIIFGLVFICGGIAAIIYRRYIILPVQQLDM